MRLLLSFIFSISKVSNAVSAFPVSALPFPDVSLILSCPGQWEAPEVAAFWDLGIYYLHNPYPSSRLAQDPTFSKEEQHGFPFC